MLKWHNISSHIDIKLYFRRWWKVLLSIMGVFLTLCACLVAYDILGDPDPFSYHDREAIYRTAMNDARKEEIRQEGVFGSSTDYGFTAAHEGDAWVLATSVYSWHMLNTGHAELFYIVDGQRHLISFEPRGELSYGDDVSSLDWGDPIHDPILGHGMSALDATYADILYVGAQDGVTRDGGYQVTFIPRGYGLDVRRIRSWQLQQDHNLPDYNTFAHNCSDEVIDALHAWWVVGVSRHPLPNTPASLTVRLRAKLAKMSEKIQAQQSSEN